MLFQRSFNKNLLHLFYADKQYTFLYVVYLADGVTQVT
jgi:hypothetical protein